jgi:hypothetical protein
MQLFITVLQTHHLDATFHHSITNPLLRCNFSLQHYTSITQMQLFITVLQTHHLDATSHHNIMSPSLRCNFSSS